MERQALSKLMVATVLGMIVGGIGGAQTSILQSESEKNILSDYPRDLSMTGMHKHDRREVSSDEAPSVDLQVEQDEMMKGQYNLHIQTENFSFAPESVSSEHVMGEGHAHVFVDDVKISRAYSNYYHLPRLKPGEHAIKVTLNTNEHEEYAVNGESVSDAVTVSFEPK